MSRRDIDNERIKLLANAFNSAAVSSFTVGVLVPVAALFYGASGIPFLGLIAGVVAWLAVALVLHLIARHFLGGLN